MRFVFRSVVCVVAALTACASDPIGRNFTSEGELLRAIHPGDVIARLDVQFPARVVRIEKGGQGLNFSVGDTPHEYPASLGAVRAVFIEHGAGRGVLVLRAGPGV